MKSLQKFITSLEKLADVVYQTLGDGFSEDIYQRALAFEFRDKGITGGLYKADMASLTATGATLLVFYTPALEETLNAVTTAGGIIIKPIFAFPGGRRFHFTEPSGNEFAVWSDK